MKRSRIDSYSGASEVKSDIRKEHKSLVGEEIDGYDNCNGSIEAKNDIK